MRQPRTSLKVPAPSTPSETTDEAIDIVDQLLAGAKPSREQLMVIKSEVQNCAINIVGYHKSMLVLLLIAFCILNHYNFRALIPTCGA